MKPRCAFGCMNLRIPGGGPVRALFRMPTSGGVPSPITITLINEVQTMIIPFQSDFIIMNLRKSVPLFFTIYLTSNLSLYPANFLYFTNQRTCQPYTLASIVSPNKFATSAKLPSPSSLPNLFPVQKGALFLLYQLFGMREGFRDDGGCSGLKW